MPDLFNLFPQPWRAIVNNYLLYLSEVEKAIFSQEDIGKQVLPERELIFSALELNPTKIRVVIVGQDPYPCPDHAIGRAFAVNQDVLKIPGSLRNILKERAYDFGGVAPSYDLKEWHDQGVLLLNSTLTVNAGESNSHKSFGWEKITLPILNYLASNGVPALLWGKDAQKFGNLFGARAVMSAHPSPLSAHRGFHGSRPFTQINKILDQPIKW